MSAVDDKARPAPYDVSVKRTARLLRLELLVVAVLVAGGCQRSAATIRLLFPEPGLIGAARQLKVEVYARGPADSCQQLGPGAPLAQRAFALPAAALSFPDLPLRAIHVVALVDDGGGPLLRGCAAVSASPGDEVEIVIELSCVRPDGCAVPDGGHDGSRDGGPDGDLGGGAGCDPATAFATHDLGDMVFCEARSTDGVDLCSAVTLCQAGWQLCTPAQYRARFSSAAPPVTNVWLGSCIRNDAEPYQPGAAPCASCARAQLDYAFDSWACGSGEDRVSSPWANIGVMAFASECRRVGVNEAAHEAYWTSALSWYALEGAVCCPAP